MADQEEQPADRFKFIEIAEAGAAGEEPEAAPPARGAPAAEGRVAPPPKVPLEAKPARAPVRAPQFSPLGESEARTLLKEWVDKRAWRRWLHRPEWGERAQIVEVRNQVGYRVRLLTEYERRELRYDEVRVKREPLSTGQAVEDLWSYPMEAPTDFVQRADSYPIPGTDELVDCQSCHGMGLTRCPRCRGRGVVWEQGMLGEEHAYEAPLECPACRGSGMVRCDHCRGIGQMRRFAVVAAKFTVRDLSLVVHSSPLPDSQLRTVRGEAFFRRREEGTLEIPSIAPPVAEALGLLQGRSGPAYGERLLFQQVEAEAFPLVGVTFKAGRGRNHQFWVFGRERRLFVAPGWHRACVSWSKVASLLLAAIAVLGGAAYAYLRFLVR